MEAEKTRYGGMKMTPQRIAILDYLKDNRTHPSAADIFRCVSARFPTMSFATVYNTLETLKGLGVVKELSIDAGKKRFDPDTRPHSHLVCLGCHQVVDVVRDFYLELSEAERFGFAILANEVNFYGLCPACLQDGRDKRTTKT